MPPTPPIPNAYWVRPGRLLAGEYPGDWDEDTTRKKLRRLLEAGVSLFVDLTQAGEYGLAPYAPALKQVAAELGCEVTYRRWPIRDRGTPDAEGMRGILDSIDAALAEGETVYVHCYAGIGRTGTAVGCHLARHGVGGEESLAEIARLRQDISEGWIRSPETEAQRRMVLDWPVGE